jgi:glutathionyl-hydroquinone reductase
MTLTTCPFAHTDVLCEEVLSLHHIEGLFLIVKTTGKKLWRFRYQRPATKKRTMVGLGSFPALSLADARAL